MRRRRFLAAGGAALAAGLAGCASRDPRPATSDASGGPALLTVSGFIGPGNRGPLDPALDQMMQKQGVTFERAHTFDSAALAELPAVTIRPTLEYDGERHELSGPLLYDVLAQAGPPIPDGAPLVLRAVDGYAVRVPMGLARERRFLVATHLDGAPMPLGGLGPLWAVYDADRVPETATLPLEQRFILCPWALYHVEVGAA